MNQKTVKETLCRISNFNVNPEKFGLENKRAK